MPVVPPPSPRPPLGLEALSPFRERVFTLLWTTWLMSNLGMWMNDVSAAWLMTSMTSSPAWVALVQTAATLPVFLLGLPSGALADMLDRRRVLLATQVWLATVSVLLAVLVLHDALTPLTLLVLVFAHGIGLSMRWPVFAALVPHLVPRAQLPQALALNGVSMNASRILGPLVAGTLIASAGAGWVYALNAVMALASIAILWHWRSAPPPQAAARQPLMQAVREGVRYVQQAPGVRALYGQIAVFFFHSTALTALLPLLALHKVGGSAASFTGLLAAMGAGAIGMAFALPRVRRSWPPHVVTRAGFLVQAAAMAGVVWAPSVVWAVPPMVMAGMAWISTANTLSVAVQTLLPDWVRARGMSLHQMAIMGGAAGGAAGWGQVAHWTSPSTSVLLAAVSGSLAGVWLTRRTLDLPGPARATVNPHPMDDSP